jgi:hypothetical protein
MGWGVLKLAQENTLKAEDVIEILQMYKPAIQKLFRRHVALYFDRNHKEIGIEVPGGGLPFTTSFTTKLGYREPRMEELVRAGTIVKVVDEWLEQLSTQQAEAVFWRYICHDFELVADESDWRIRYKTLSYREIAQKMGISLRRAYVLVQRGLRGILRYANGEEVKTGRCGHGESAGDRSGNSADG